MKVNEAAVNVNQKHSILKAKSHNQLTLARIGRKKKPSASS
jgi:hypothetical protein